MTNDAIIKALLADRDGYARSGLTDLVAMIDNRLRALGHTVEGSVEVASVTPAKEKSTVKRSAPRRKA